MTNKIDAQRELQKIHDALSWAVTHHSKQSEANAALHMNPKVLYSPLAVALENAEKSLTKVWDYVENGDVDASEESN